MIPTQNIGQFGNFVAIILSLTCKGKNKRQVDSADRYNELLRTTNTIGILKVQLWRTITNSESQSADTGEFVARKICGVFLCPNINL